CPQQVRGSEEVDLHQTVDLVRGCLHEGAIETDAGVGHHDVDRSQVGFDFRDGGLDLGEVANVGRDQNAAAADLIEYLLEVLLVAGDQAQAGALARRRPGHSPAYSARGAGD